MISAQTHVSVHRPGNWVFCPISSTNIDNGVFKDKRLTIAGRGLLCTILALPKTSNISFSTLYTDITSRYTKEELKRDEKKNAEKELDLSILIKCFEELIRMEYLHPDLIDDLDDLKGLQKSRYVPLVKLLTGKLK